MRHAPRSLARRSPHFLLAAVSAAVLSACGGGGDTSTGSTDGGGTGGGGGVVTPTALTVSGVAAKGAALAGATVDASCATGNGSATAQADGSYSLSITGGALPCVLKATSSDDTTTFYSLAAGTGAAATANITPLTELVIAQMTGQEPAAFYASASTDTAALSAAVTAEKIDAASTAVIETLQAAGVDTTAITSIVSGSLSAGTGAGYDGVLDTLGTTLASNGTSLGELVTTVATVAAAASPSAPATTSGGDTVTTSLLPAALLLKAKAETCAALRSTEYRFIVVKPSVATGATDPVTTLGLGTMDVAAAGGPTFDFGDGNAVLTPVAGESCHYTVAGTDALSGDLVVSPSGLAVGRLINTWTDGETVADPNARMVIAMPVQQIAVADLTGDWNVLGWNTETATTSSVDPVLVNFATDGQVTVKCDGTAPSAPLSSCTTSDGPYTGLTANADGGFDLTTGPVGDVWKERVFAYRAGNGQTALVVLGADGSLHFATRQRTLTAPTVGDAHKAWNVQINAARVAADALTYNGFEVTAVDATAGTFARTVTALATGVSHSQTLGLNDARDGWIHRAAGSTTGSDGSAVTIREMYTVKLGVGVSAYWLPANNQAGTNARFALSVTHP